MDRSISEKMKLAKRKRDVGVEFFRIIACVIVIGTHVKLQDLPALLPLHQIDVSKTIIGGFFGEGVTIFFLIMGFFFFNNSSFKQLLFKIIKSIIIPALFYIYVAQILSRWVCGESNLVQSIIHPGFTLENISGIFSWDASKIHLGSHLWYLFTYVQIVFWFPVLHYFVREGAQADKVRKYLLIMSGITVVLRDMQKIVSFDWGTITWYSIIPMSIFIVILGYEIYQKRGSLYGNKKLFLCGIVLYLTAHALLTFFQLVLYKRDYTIGHVFSWDSTFAILGAVGLTISVLSIEFKSDRLEKIICYNRKKYILHISYPFSCD